MAKKETINDLMIFLLVASLFLLDILTKYIFTNKSFFAGNLIFIKYTENYGSSFGIFSSIGFYPALITALSIVAIVVLIFFYRRFSDDKYLVYFFTFLLSGLLGNTFDRAFYGFVRDFIALKYLFIFNLADLYITIAFVIILIKEFYPKKNKRK